MFLSGQNTSSAQISCPTAHWKNLTWCLGQSGSQRTVVNYQGQRNSPCIIKKGLVCSPRSREVPLADPTRVPQLWPPRDEEHDRSSLNQPLILSGPLWPNTLSLLKTSSANLSRVKQVSDLGANEGPPPFSALFYEKVELLNCPQMNFLLKPTIQTFTKAGHSTSLCSQAKMFVFAQIQNA